jgi:putative transposase
VLDPDGAAYVPVPYRNVAHPAVSVWEHRQALVRLKQRGAGQVDEHALFAMIDQMRRITDEATKTTRRTRRESERRRHAPRRGRVTAASWAAAPTAAGRRWGRGSACAVVRRH